MDRNNRPIYAQQHKFLRSSLT